MKYELCIYPISKELVIYLATPWDQTQNFSQLYSEGYSLELNHVVSCWGKGAAGGNLHMDVASGFQIVSLRGDLTKH